MGALLGGPHNSPLLVGPVWKKTVKKPQQMGSSAVWASDKGSCSEAPEGAAGQEPVKLGTGGTPLIEEENLPCSQTSENLEGLTDKVGPLGL